MLQARLVSYADAHLHRLGVNHHQIPVNAPRSPVQNYIRDGALATAPYGGAPNYWPNSHAGAPLPNPAYAEPAWQLGQAIADRFDSTVDHDDFTQAGNLYRLFDEGHKDRLTTRLAGALSHARKEVQERQVGHFFKADEDYGRRVATKLGLEVNHAEGAKRAAVRV
jgi:catalase